MVNVNQSIGVFFPNTHVFEFQYNYKLIQYFTITKQFKEIDKYGIPLLVLQLNNTNGFIPSWYTNENKLIWILYKFLQVLLIYTSSPTLKHICRAPNFNCNLHFSFQITRKNIIDINFGLLSIRTMHDHIILNISWHQTLCV